MVVRGIEIWRGIRRGGGRRRCCVVDGFVLVSRLRDLVICVDSIVGIGVLALSKTG